MTSILGITLPDLWSTSPLKHVTTLLSRGSAPTYVDNGAVRAISQAANQDAGLNWSRTRFHEFNGDPRTLKGYLLSGDILINSTGTGTLGRVGYFSEATAGIPCMADSHITVARSKADELHPRFAYYWLKSRPFQDYVYEALVVGATNQIELNRDRLSSAPVPLPTLEEQCRIANFLDIEMEKITTFNYKTRRLAHLLDEKISSRILNHVGVSKLNDMQHGSPVREIRRLLSKAVRPPIHGGEVITAYRDGQVTARSLRRPEGYTMPAATEAQGQRVERGDVVIHGLDGFAGAIGTSEATGNCSPVYHVCTPRNDGDPLFYGRLLHILAVSGYLELFATSTRERAVDFRNWDLFGRIPIPDVPRSEQQEIGKWISSARPIRVAVDKSNALAQERSQALITAAITGQFDVSSASGRGTEN